MAAPSKAIHLGTNTDAFSIGSPTINSQYWIRYTLDPSSYRSEIPQGGYDLPSNSGSITGELWLVYKSSWLSLNSSRTVGAWGSADYAGYDTSTFQTAQQTINGPSHFVQFACAPGQPNGSLGCESDSTLNLSFLQLKNGGLYTSKMGFDMAYFELAKEGETVNQQMNIAYAPPVPLPPALLLLCSGLAGIAGFSRRTMRG